MGRYNHRPQSLTKCEFFFSSVARLALCYTGIVADRPVSRFCKNQEGSFQPYAEIQCQKPFTILVAVILVLVLGVVGLLRIQTDLLHR